MQLKKPAGANRRRQPTLAALTLIGGGAHAQSSATYEGADTARPLQFDSGLLYYQESDNRIKDVEAIVAVRQPLSEDSAWNLHFTLDAVCGGSPIGAIPSKVAQSFVTPNATSLNPPVVVTQTTTSASGGGGGGLDNLGGSLCTNPVQNQKYTVAPGALPIDQSFHDQRVALSGGYETALGTRNKLSVGAAVSHELDFFSGSVNALLSRDFNNRNTTVAAGLNVETDTISPVGGAPVPGSLYGDFQKRGNENKNVQDVLLGVTQVVTRRWITQGNVSVEHSSGYETDPYKIVTEVDAQGNDAAGVYMYESRPGRATATASTGTTSTPSTTTCCRPPTGTRATAGAYVRTRSKCTTASRWANGGTSNRTCARIARVRPISSISTCSGCPSTGLCQRRSAPGRLQWPDLRAQVRRPDRQDRRVQRAPGALHPARHDHQQHAARPAGAGPVSGHAGDDGADRGSRNFKLPPMSAETRQSQGPARRPCRRSSARHRHRGPARRRARGALRGHGRPLRDPARRRGRRRRAAPGPRRGRGSLAHRAQIQPLPRRQRHRGDQRQRRPARGHRRRNRDACSTTPHNATTLSDGLFDITSGVLRRAWHFDGSDRVPTPRRSLRCGRWSAGKVPRTPAPDAAARHGNRSGRPGQGICGRPRARSLARQRCSGAGQLWRRPARSARRAGEQPWHVAHGAPSTTRRRAGRHAGAVATAPWPPAAMRTATCCSDGVRYSHILDPRTGWPVVAAPRCVTVAAASCIEAGTLSTIALLQGAGASGFSTSWGRGTGACARDVQRPVWNLSR